MSEKNIAETGVSITTNGHYPVTGIGASAGGLEAFKQLVTAIPEQTGIVYIFIQHLDPAYETVLSEILGKLTRIPVADLTEKTILLPNHIYVVPSNKQLIVKDDILLLELKPDTLPALRLIDTFFSAIAEIFQSQATGILLSGMGSDGTIGLKKIKDYGGVTIIQELNSARYPAMPKHALDADVADFQLLPAEIPQQLMQIHSTLNILPAEEGYTVQQLEEENNFKEILNILRIRREADFTYYKQSTIRRRILRRMVINRIDNLTGYVELLTDNPSEQDILYQDMLIPVTAFFRDATIFEALCNKVFPDIFKITSKPLPVRIWVAGCSTGEEAYSIAMCIHEFLGDDFANVKLQLFATDISEKAIQKARSGIYSRREIAGVSETRLLQHFIKTDGHYHLKKNIRDLCVFATHNFLKDPPFAKMDFISCRNVMIYMDSYLQKKVLGTFHYALNDRGYLLLGKSETASNAAELFAVANKHEKLYSRKPIQGRTMRLMPETSEKYARSQKAEIQLIKQRKEDFDKNADDVLLAKYIPSGVVINEHFEVVQFRGSTGTFLESAPGKASLNVLKMAKEGLSFEIRNAVQKARDSREAIIKKDVPINNGKIMVTLEVTPLLQTIEPYYLVIFRDVPGIFTELSNADPAKAGGVNKDHARIVQLEKELAQLREDMRAVTQEQEGANEELQSANEELLSGSEELQSLNEELETSKEEIQSTNEELMTVNQELYDRNEQYNQARLYAESIITTIREPLLVLNRDLRIKSANTAFYEWFGLIEEDITGKILFELEDNTWDIPVLRTQLLKIQTGQLKQLEWEVNFSIPRLGDRTIFLNAQPVNPEHGDQMILLAFKDITLQKNEALRLTESALALKEELNLIELFFTQVPALFCILKGPNHMFEFANPRYLQVSGGLGLKGKTFGDAFPELLNEGYKDILDSVYQTGDSFYGQEMKAMHYPGKDKPTETYIDLSVQAYRDSGGKILGVLFFSYEVTAQVLARRSVEKNAASLEVMVTDRTSSLVEANKELEKSNNNLQAFASIASHDLQEPLRKIKTFLRMLKDRYATDLPEEAVSLILKTETAAGRMSNLIKDVLNYSRVLAPETSYSTVDFNIVLRNIQEDFELLISEKNAILLTGSPLPVIDAVPSQINQLFYNLIGNALKFTSPDRQPTIEISAELLHFKEKQSFEELNPQVAYYKFMIADNGIGFESQYAEQIFAIFERLNSSGIYEGTGIGLALCRRIVQHHKGVIYAKGNHGGGSTFTVILPTKQTGIKIEQS